MVPGDIRGHNRVNIHVSTGKKIFENLLKKPHSQKV
jgi:hypothetical protein